MLKYEFGSIYTSIWQQKHFYFIQYLFCFVRCRFNL